MDTRIQTFHANTIDEVIRYALQVESDSNNLTYFRGENQDFGATALTPSVYRGGLLEHEHNIYREMQRFNDHEFTTDKTAFDKLARMQHYTTPTRMIDLSEDILSSLYFALDGREEGVTSVLYMIEIDANKIKYYDSDAVSILANLAKSPLHQSGDSGKSKETIWREAKDYINDREGYNQAMHLKSKGYFLHDIREEKSYFQDVIDPKDLFSVLAVKPKLTSQRIQSQKGAFLLYGLNIDDYQTHFQVITDQLELNPEKTYHPIIRITKIYVGERVEIDDLEKIGISKAYVYPELDRVSEYLSDKYKESHDK